MYVKGHESCPRFTPVTRFSPLRSFALVLVIVTASCRDQSPVSPKTASIVTNLQLLAGNDQSALVNTAVQIAPAVQVSDADGRPLRGIEVSFAVTAGGGTITGATQVTDANGIARVGRWTLGGSAGTNVLTATISGAAPVTFTATANVSHFDIELVFQSSVTQGQRNAFEAAAAKWARVIVGDLGTADVQTGANSCTPAINALINDVRIYVTIEPIDGQGKVLGSAGPCFIREGSRLPIVGAMRFDSADLGTLESGGRLMDVILHEMGHVLGIGTLWSTKELLMGADGNDPFFPGAEAVARFNSIGGIAYNGNKVPVENTGGGGTAGGHWRESVFENELMTGFLDAGPNPMSTMTIGSLQDLGYTVNMAEADGYIWMSQASVRGVQPPKLQMVGDRLSFTPRVLPRR